MAPPDLGELGRRQLQTSRSVGPVCNWPLPKLLGASPRARGGFVRGPWHPNHPPTSLNTSARHLAHSSGPSELDLARGEVVT